MNNHCHGCFHPDATPCEGIDSSSLESRLAASEAEVARLTAANARLRDWGEKGDLARQNAQGMEEQIAELTFEVARLTAELAGMDCVVSEHIEGDDWYTCGTCPSCAARAGGKP